MVRTHKIGHEDNFFSLCPRQPETNDHIFFCFQKAQRGWAAIAILYERQPLNNSLVNAQSIIDIIGNSLSKSPVNTTRLFVVYHTCWNLWTHRNDKVYNHYKQPQLSPLVTTDQAKEHIAVAAKYSNSYKKRRQL